MSDTINAAPATTDTDSQQEAVERAQRAITLDSLKLGYAGALEAAGHYTDAGVFYAATSPMAASVGAELGIVTRDEKTGKTQRSGVGFYLRCDHLAKIEHDGCTKRY